MAEGHAARLRASPATGGIRWLGLWTVALRADLRRALVEEDLRKIEVWTAPARRRHRGMARQAGRPVLQRQYARRPGPRRGYCSAQARHIAA